MIAEVYPSLGAKVVDGAQNASTGSNETNVAIRMLGKTPTLMVRHGSVMLPVRIHPGFRQRHERVAAQEVIALRDAA